MKVDLGDLDAFVAVALANGFRDAARMNGGSASGLSDAVRRLESKLGVRLLNRTTRSVVLTDAGKSLFDRLTPVLNQLGDALDVVNDFREQPRGTLRINVPVSAARLVLPSIIPNFLAAYPDIHLEVIAEESFVDVLAAGCDAGIRYEERLEQDMIAVPIGPRIQRFATAASPTYLKLHGKPQHPRDLLNHACLKGRFASGSEVSWEFARNSEVLRIDPKGPLLVRIGGATDLAVDVSIAGTGIVYLFEDWLRPHFNKGTLEPILEDWWVSFSGPYLYYPGRRFVPAPLRAFIDFIKRVSAQDS